MILNRSGEGHKIWFYVDVRQNSTPHLGITGGS